MQQLTIHLNEFGSLIIGILLYLNKYKSLELIEAKQMPTATFKIHLAIGF